MLSEVLLCLVCCGEIKPLPLLLVCKTDRAEFVADVVVVALIVTDASLSSSATVRKCRGQTMQLPK